MQWEYREKIILVNIMHKKSKKYKKSSNREIERNSP